MVTTFRSFETWASKERPAMKLIEWFLWVLLGTSEATIVLLLFLSALAVI